jgi:hypothetical protein
MIEWAIRASGVVEHRGGHMIVATMQARARTINIKAPVNPFHRIEIPAH